MSGFGAPARTATAMPDFAKLARLLAASLPCLITSSVPLSPKMQGPGFASGNALLNVGRA